MPYIKIETAAWLKFPDGTPVVSPDAYLGWHVLQVESRGVARVLQIVASGPWARVNHGRWIADCPECGAGMFTHPEWRLACCAECGAVYRDVKFPPNWRAVEVVMLQRPKRENQNWDVTETLDDLQRESLAHGVR